VIRVAERSANHTAGTARRAHNPLRTVTYTSENKDFSAMKPGGLIPVSFLWDKARQLFSRAAAFDPFTDARAPRVGERLEGL
jgi:hypothetical protein